MDWESASFHSLLWFSSDPGCGKSVLMSFLVDESQKLASKRNTCYFFFKADNDEQGDAAHALRAILHQLYKAQPHLIRHAISQLAIPGNNVRNLRTLWKIFTETVGDPSSVDTFCFIDAIDECEPASRKDLIQLISEYFNNKSKKESSPPPYLKMIIASRPENSLKTVFDKHLAVPKTESSGTHKALHRSRSSKETPARGLVSIIRLRGEDETDSITHDIELVVEAAIDDLISKGLPQDLLEDLQEEIIKRADRTFLWTALIIELLKERSEAGASRRELYSILHSRDIDYVYAGLLEGRKSPIQARRLLSFILAAKRPLTLEELNVALAIVPDHETFSESDTFRRPKGRKFDELALDLIYPFENHVKSLCGHFLRIIRGRVYLVHETAREYLKPVVPNTWKANEIFMPFIADEELKKDLVDDKNLKFAIANRPQTLDIQERNKAESVAQPRPIKNSFKSRESHAILLEVCVTYLYMLGMEGYCKVNFQVHAFEQLAIGKFLDYAARFWTTHFQKVYAKIPSSALACYHGLCHPMFPGFQIWPDIMARYEMRTFGLSDDETQDYYLRHFGLLGPENGFCGDELVGDNHGDEDDNSDKDDDDGNRFADARSTGIGIDMRYNDQYNGQRNSQAHDSGLLTFSQLSTNPSALNNRNFPLDVDETGFVSLKRL